MGSRDGHNVLVTGGNGFIGSHVVDLLLEKGYDVTIFDRHHPAGTREGVTKYLGDLKDAEAVSDAISRCDGVINLAGILGTAETVNTARESIKINVEGALNVFEACRRYEKRCVHITVGNYTWFNTYAITKYSSERFALMYNSEFHTKICVVRGLNVYGPRQKAAPVKKVVPNFILSALENKPVIIYGDGKQLLDLIYVRDTAEVLIRALLMEHNLFDKTIEAGSGKLYTANQLAELVIKTSGSSSSLEHIPMRAGEPSRSVTKGDPSTLEPLEYRPTTSLEEGIAETVTWYKEHFKPH